MRPVLALALALFGASGCGSSDASSSTSGGGPENCSFTGALSGGVTGSIAANGCSTGTSASFAISHVEFVGSTSLGVAFSLKTALKGGETGPIPLTKMEVVQREGENQPQLRWSSDTCTLALDSNVSAPTSVFRNRFELAGHGSCAAPLAPVAPNTKPAVTISPFEFKAFVNP